MNNPRFMQRVIGLIFLTGVILAGCAAPATEPPVSQPSPVSSTQPILENEQPSLFRYIETVQVTPDGNTLSGVFARINYLPAADRFVVTFGGDLAQPAGGCTDRGYSYKVYTLDMQATGESGTFACDSADAGSIMVDNTYYHVAMAATEVQYGWHLLKIDALNWQPLVDLFLPLEYPMEASSDPMVAYINGQLDLSGEYDEDGQKPPINEGRVTFHLLFSPALDLLDKRILADTPHINGSSMIYVDGIYYFVTADAFSGNVVVMQYDNDWNYLGVKTLVERAHWSTGLAYDGQRFFLAYLDTSQRGDPAFLPVFLNVHLAAFDRAWNLIEDVAVTDYTPAENMQTGRPWVILHGNRLYVSYDLDTRDPDTHQEDMKNQAMVRVYELTQMP